MLISVRFSPIDCLRSFGHRNLSQKLMPSDEEFEAFLQISGVFSLTEFVFAATV